MSVSNLEPLPVREGEVIRLLSRLRFLTAAHVAEFLFAGSTVSPGSRAVMTRRILGSLRLRKLITISPPNIGGSRRGATPPVYYLTEAGDHFARAAVAGATRRRLKSSGALLAPHSLATADVVLAFQRSAKRNVDHDLVSWESDWEVAQPLGPAAVVPDAYVLYRVGERRLHAFVEVDLGSEHNRTFAGKLRRYLELQRGGTWHRSFPVWPYVLIVATSPARAAQLRRIAELVSIDHSGTWRGGAGAFHFAALVDLLADAGPLAPIWRTVHELESVSLLRSPTDLASPVAYRAVTNSASRLSPEPRS
jgi:Replication-relaxation